jgi:hypothetical protein
LEEAKENVWQEDMSVSGIEGEAVKVTPRKSLGSKPAAIISRSNSFPTRMWPGGTVSSRKTH